MKFLPKLCRNTLVLGLAYFFSNFANFVDYSLDEWRPIIIFCGMYLCAELINHYHINAPPSKKSKSSNSMLVL
jgi:hypothetical protein